MKANCEKECHFVCMDWAQNGECDIDPKFMMVSCKKECDAIAGGDASTGGGDTSAGGAGGSGASWCL